MKKNAAQLLFVALIVAGCQSDDNKITEVNCGDEITKSAMRSLVQDALEESVKKAVAEGVGREALPWDAAKFRALASSLAIDLTNVRTAKKDPNSTKRFCEAELRVVIPSDLSETADKVRKSLGYQNVASHAVALDIKYEAGTVSDDIEYSAQPTDDGKKVYVSTAKLNKSGVLLTSVLSANLLKSLIDAAEAKKVKDQEDESARLVLAEQRKQDLEKEQSRLTLEKAQAGIKDANDQINAVWNAAPSEFRKTMLSEQRIWLKERDVDCKIKAAAAGEGIGEVAREVIRLDCETEMTALRTIYLKAKAATE